MRTALLVLASLCLAWLVSIHPASSATSTTTTNQRVLRRSDAKRWKDQTQRFRNRVIPSKSQAFLSNRGQDMSIPIVIDVILVGFDGDGAFQYKLDAQKFEELLQNSFNEHCPAIWDAQEQTSTCYFVTYNVVSMNDYHQDITSLEAQLQHNIHLVSPGTDPQSNVTEKQLPLYAVEAALVEPWFRGALQAVYNEEDSTGSKHWHKHNAIFLVNPVKARMKPVDHHYNVTATPLNVSEEWSQGHFSKARYDAQEAGFTYRYSYNSNGAGNTWISSENYVVVDISAGPSRYGPVSSPQGGVSPRSVPRLMDLYEGVLTQLRAETQTTAIEDSVKRALDAQHNVYTGQLMEVVISAAQHVFMPDLAHERIEYAKRILVPILVLRDHDDVDPLALTNDSEFNVDLDAINHAVKELISPEQKIVLTSGSYYVHHHPNLLSAVHKAMHTEAEMHWEEGGGTKGVRMQLNNYLDGPTLLEEFRLSSDMLTYGLFEPEDVEQEYNWEAEHDLKHHGTRTVPVFVLSLKSAPENLMFHNKMLYAADSDCVIVLQLTDPTDHHGVYTGGVFSGHLEDGERVVVDVHNPTRHIIAGLSTAIAGIVPPYTRYDAQHSAFIDDWRWAIGGIPFGPYSSYHGITTMTAAIAQRNIIISHVEAALRKAQAAQSSLDEVVRRHLQSPTEAVVNDESQSAHHYLTELHEGAKSHAKRKGFNTTLTSTVVEDLDALLTAVDSQLSIIMMAMYDHKFQEMDGHVNSLHIAVDRFDSRVENIVREVEDLMMCCSILHQNDGILTTGGIVGAIVAFVGLTSLMLLIMFSRPTGKKKADRRTSRGILG